MGSLFLMAILFITTLVVAVIRFPKEAARLKKIVVFGLVGTAATIGMLGAFSYNDAGYQKHVRTIFGTESAVLDTGWYFEGWGRSTTWPKFITIANTLDPTANGSEVNPPYRVRLADNWTGDVTQSTRFGIPNDTELFLTMAQTFRTPERLISTTLMPGVNASIDSVANMFTMEEYYSGGQRDQFKSEFSDTIMYGRAQVRQISLNQAGGIIQSARARANDDDATDNSGDVGDTDVRRLIMQKILDENGEVIRVEHDYLQYGIVVNQAILEGIDPDDEYELQINDRKQASSRRVVAREQRLEQEEQRLLAIQSGATDIARRQAAAEVVQIERTTDAETEKQLVLINAGRMQEEAAFARDTAAINLERARIDAESVTVAADAEAYAKEAILMADGALAQKLEAWVESQRVWAAAAADLQVPTTVIGGSGEGVNSINSAQTLMDLLMVNTAQQLSLDPSITAPRQ
jgi:hypothetical protein